MKDKIILDRGEELDNQAKEENFDDWKWRALFTFFIVFGIIWLFL